MSSDTTDHIVVLTRMTDDGHGTGRIWYVPQELWREVEALLPEPDESAIYTPETTDMAQAYRDQLLLIDHTGSSDAE